MSEEPGERRLDRAPGERYRPGPGAASQGPAGAAGRGVADPGIGRAVLAGLAVAAGCAVVLGVLGEVDLGVGLLVLGAASGWLVALAVVWGSGGRPVPRRSLVAAVLAAAAVLGALLLSWALSRVQGGVLGPLDYVDQRFGPLAWATLAVALVVAAIRAR